MTYNRNLVEYNNPRCDERGQYVVQLMQYKTDFLRPVNISITKCLYKWDWQETYYAGKQMC